MQSSKYLQYLSIGLSFVTIRPSQQIFNSAATFSSRHTLVVRLVTKGSSAVIIGWL